jgi:curved DNA-binding protein CbpA
VRIESWIRHLDGADPYELLGLDRTADRTAIIRAHRQRIRRVHPDLPTGDTERARLVHLARDILLDPQRRRAYDLLAAAGPAGPQPPSRPRTAAGRAGSARPGDLRAGARSARDDPEARRGGRQSPWLRSPPHVPPRRRPPPPPQRPARDPPRRPGRPPGAPRSTTSRAAEVGTVVAVAIVVVVTWTCCAVVTLML